MAFRYEEAWLREAMRWVWWRRTGRAAAFWVVTILATSAVAFGVGAMDEFLVGLVGLGLVVLGLLAGGSYWLLMRSVGQLWKEIGDGLVRVEMDETGLRVESVAGEIETAWSGVTEVWRGEAYWLVFLGAGRMVVTLPRGELSGEAREYLRGKVTEAGGEGAVEWLHYEGDLDAGGIGGGSLGICGGADPDCAG